MGGGGVEFVGNLNTTVRVLKGEGRKWRRDCGKWKRLVCDTMARRFVSEFEERGVWFGCVKLEGVQVLRIQAWRGGDGRMEMCVTVRVEDGTGIGIVKAWGVQMWASIIQSSESECIKVAHMAMQLGSIGICRGSFAQVMKRFETHEDLHVMRTMMMGKQDVGQKQDVSEGVAVVLRDGIANAQVGDLVVKCMDLSGRRHVWTACLSESSYVHLKCMAVFQANAMMW